MGGAGEERRDAVADEHESGEDAACLEQDRIHAASLRLSSCSHRQDHSQNEAERERTEEPSGRSPIDLTPSASTTQNVVMPATRVAIRFLVLHATATATTRPAISASVIPRFAASGSPAGSP